MKNILVPCDFSDAAVYAFKFAKEIAGLGRGDVTLLHVIEVPTLRTSGLYFEDTLYKEASAKAAKYIEKMIAKWPLSGGRVHQEIRFGTVATTVGDVIKEKKIDLVIMGTKGATGMKEFLIGSNTEKIVRISRVPVIAVKQPVAASSIKNIVFPNTLGADQEELTMRVKALQNFFKANLHIVYVNTPAHFKSDRQTVPLLKAFAKRFMIRNFTTNVYNDIDHESGIINFSHQVNADMIVMATHGRRGISHLLMGSIAEDVVNHVDCPIWTFSSQ